MSKINKTFTSGETLKSADLNTIVSTVNGELYDESGDSKLTQLSLKVDTIEGQLTGVETLLASI